MLKRFINKNFAFTLTELLIALTVIGAVAAMSVPTLVEGLHKRSMITQVKGLFTSIQQIAKDQLLSKRVTNLRDTDFVDPAKLMTDKYFQISKKCATASDCWSESYKRLSDFGNIDTRIKGENIDSGKSVILKNGAIVTYTVNLTTAYPVMTGTNDRVMGMFRIDINGPDKPNIVGRDVFWFLITEKGRVVDYYTGTNNLFNKDTATTQCRNAQVITACLSLVQRSNWTIEY